MKRNENFKANQNNNAAVDNQKSSHAFANRNYSGAKEKRRAFTIEEEINGLFQRFAKDAAESIVVTKEKGTKGGSCRGIINIFRADDLRREQLEREAEKPKRFKAYPMERYAFYPDSYDETRLGSVAIYGEDVMKRYFAIKKSGVLFGHAVRKVSIEWGVRPFIDVTLSRPKP